MSKQARFARLHVIEAIDFRHRLGYGADFHRIDPRAFERLRGEDPNTGVGSLRPPVSAPAGLRGPQVPSSPRSRWSEAA